jgi:hypothetical protein
MLAALPARKQCSESLPGVANFLRLTQTTHHNHASRIALLLHHGYVVTGEVVSGGMHDLHTNKALNMDSTG